MRDRATGKLLEPADYSELGMLLVVQVTLVLVLPITAILVVRLARAKTM